ncbi:hypothetical protein [Streptomyces sp. MMG1121]|uniref:hypothetical protein n=1 Tax=Streptomyces sp. MMG1121 TaxID=1415544 RepID=UPI0018FE3D24|nr:hypothetical protein [Streptomyces sp. MMG1121]
MAEVGGEEPLDAAASSTVSETEDAVICKALLLLEGCDPGTEETSHGVILI